MRPLHVLDHSLPLHSGYAFRTLGVLRGQQGMGWSPVCLTTPRQGPFEALTETHEGFDFHRTPLPQARAPVLREREEMRTTTGRIIEAARAVGATLLHAHSPALCGLPAAAAGRRLGLPVVYEIRAFWEDAAVDLGHAWEGGPRYRATRWMETRAARRASQVATICEGLRGDLIERGIAPEKITVVPNACDLERHQPIRVRDEAMADALGLTGAKVLGFVGSFYAYEGLDLMLEALPALQARIPGLKLLFVGGGPEEARLKAMAEPFGEAVVFTGRVPNDQVRRYYSVIDLLCYPRRSRRLTELVTPLKPLEAMASTRPFIASSVGGHRELIRDGETGVLFRPDDPAALTEAAAGMLASDSPTKRLVRNGRAFVSSERSWAATARRYEAIYEKALSSMH